MRYMIRVEMPGGNFSYLHTNDGRIITIKARKFRKIKRKQLAKAIEASNHKFLGGDRIHLPPALGDDYYDYKL